MQVRALMPAQTLTAVTSIAAPVTMDSVTLIRRPASSSPVRRPALSSLPWVLGGGGAAVVAVGTAAYVIRRRGPADRYRKGEASGGPAWIYPTEDDTAAPGPGAS
jgi:hypothetical protein